MRRALVGRGVGKRKVVDFLFVVLVRTLERLS